MRKALTSEQRRATGFNRWKHEDEMRDEQREKILLSSRTERNRDGKCISGKKAVFLSVFSLLPLRAFGGVEADLQE